jgi:hypothetical protein
MVTNFQIRPLWYVGEGWSYKDISDSEEGFKFI